MGDSTLTITEDPRDNSSPTDANFLPDQLAGAYWMSTKASDFAQVSQNLRSVYKPGMSVNDLLAAYQSKFGNDSFAQYTAKNSKALQSGISDQSQQAGVTPPSASDAWYKSAMDRISAFADQMMKYDPNDPLAKSLAQMARSNASNQAAAQGFGSRGISENGVERAQADTAQRYQMQRQAMGQQALGQMGGMALQARGQDLTQNQFDKNFGLQATMYNNQLQQQAYQNSLAQAGQAGSTIGGVFGALVGGAAGGPMGMQQGYGMGSQMGGNIGMASQGSTMGYPTNYYGGTGFQGSSNGPYNPQYGAGGMGLNY